MAIPVYPSDLNDDEWALLAPVIPTSKPYGRPRSSDMRRITNGVFYVLRTGCGTSPYFGYGLLIVALAFLLAVATAIIGIVATAMHRQFGWMVIVLAAGLVPFGGAIVLGLITPLLVPQQQTLPVGCKPPPGTPVPTGCQTGPLGPSGFVDFLTLRMGYSPAGSRFTPAGIPASPRRRCPRH